MLHISYGKRRMFQLCNVCWLASHVGKCWGSQQTFAVFQGDGSWWVPYVEFERLPLTWRKVNTIDEDTELLLKWRTFDSEWRKHWHYSECWTNIFCWNQCDRKSDDNCHTICIYLTWIDSMWKGLAMSNQYDIDLTHNRRRIDSTVKQVNVKASKFAAWSSHLCDMMWHLTWHFHESSDRKTTEKVQIFVHKYYNNSIYNH